VLHGQGGLRAGVRVDGCEAAATNAGRRKRRRYPPALPALPTATCPCASQPAGPARSHLHPGTWRCRRTRLRPRPPCWARSTRRSAGPAALRPARPRPGPAGRAGWGPAGRRAGLAGRLGGSAGGAAAEAGALGQAAVASRAQQQRGRAGTCLLLEGEDSRGPRGLGRRRGARVQQRQTCGAAHTASLALATAPLHPPCACRALSRPALTPPQQ
jgi:hypothetical protein